MKTAALALSLLFLGCDEYDSPWKSEPVPGGTTLGQHCDDVGAVACKRKEECSSEPLPACLLQFKIECCQGTAQCARSADAATAAFLTAQCSAAYAATTCEESKAHTVPVACKW